MLLELKIENFGIIEDLRLRPGPGLNAITGETGAGKTLLLTAIEAVLGSRAGAGLVRNGAPRATVQALFDLSTAPAVEALVAERAATLSDHCLELRREINLDGRGRAYVNGQSVSLTQLRALGGALLEIHGQHEHQRILDPDTHLESLDQFAGVLPLRDRVAELYHKYSSLRRRLKSVALEAGERDRRLDFLKFAVEEIDDFDPRDGEFEELQNEKALIQNSGRLFRDLCAAYAALRENDSSALDLLVHVEQALAPHAHLLGGAVEQLQSLRESAYNLEAVADYLREQRERLQFSPERLEDLEERTQGYARLHKKYGGNTRGVLAAREQYLRELSSIEMSAEELALLRSELAVCESELLEKAEELSRLRRSVTARLEEKIAAELAQLGMPGARIVIAVRREVDGQAPAASEEEAVAPPEHAGIRTASGARYLIHEKGLDRVEFMLAANAGENLAPLRKAASGGELSRITLALKTIFFEHRPTPTLIFDEVDAGVGGEVAHTIGERLRGLAGRSQVIVVTHLHQIASLARQHYRLRKEPGDGRTCTRLRRLDGEERIREMARMLGSEGGSAAVLAHARELLQRSAAS